MTVRRSKKATRDFMAETPWIEAIGFGRIISGLASKIKLIRKKVVGQFEV